MIIAIIVTGVIALALIGLLSNQLNASDKEIKRLELLLAEQANTLQSVAALLQDLDALINSLVDCLQIEREVSEECDDIFNLN